MFAPRSPDIIVFHFQRRNEKCNVTNKIHLDYQKVNKDQLKTD